MEDMRKVRYSLEAFQKTDPTHKKPSLDKSLIEARVRILACSPFPPLVCAMQALEWQAELSASEVNSKRTLMVEQLQQAATELRQSGACARWLEKCDKTVADVCNTINGPLLETLLVSTGYKDLDCINMLREGPQSTRHPPALTPCFPLRSAGAMLMDELPLSGIGTPIDCTSNKCAEPLKKQCCHSNKALIKSMREDKNSNALLEATMADAALGRMTAPSEYDAASFQDVLLHPRFGVEQEKDDGSTKIREVDNFSWSAIRGKRAQTKPASVNGHVFPQERMKHDTLDTGPTGGSKAKQNVSASRVSSDRFRFHPPSHFSVSCCAGLLCACRVAFCYVPVALWRGR